DDARRKTRRSFTRAAQVSVLQKGKEQRRIAHAAPSRSRARLLRTAETAGTARSAALPARACAALAPAEAAATRTALSASARASTWGTALTAARCGTALTSAGAACAAAAEVRLQQVRQRVHVAQLAVLDAEQVRVGCAAAAVRAARAEGAERDDRAHDRIDDETTVRDVHAARHARIATIVG